MTTPTTSVFISIGRNIGDTPMPEPTWCSFQRDLLGIVGPLGTVVFRGIGDGFYETDEDAFTVIVDLASPVDEVDLNADLAVLAERFQQEAISTAIAVPKFVGPVSRR